MRKFLGTAFIAATFMAGWQVGPAAAQPGHAPFTFGALEIENYERTLAPAGIAGATIVNSSLVTPALGNHPCMGTGAAGQSVGCVTGAPVFLDRTQSAWEQFGGILGHIGATLTTSTYNDLFPGGTAVSPGGFPNGNFTRNIPVASGAVNPEYNGTLISLVTRTDANTEDDVGITSGNQALRVSMLNVGQGDGNTSFDRPAMLTIKENDLWGVADSRFSTFEMVRANPGDFNISIDVTLLASEMPDVFDMTPIGGNPVGPYTRMGFISGIAGSFDESPVTIVQHPAALVTNNGDADGDMLPNFTDTDYVDPGNPSILPGYQVPGVFQRRYAFPADALTWPANPLAGVADVGGNRQTAGGAQNAYLLGFVFNGSWALNTYASFIIDNMRFIDRFPTSAADFNNDGNVDGDDWHILRTHLNSTTPNLTFADGDIGSAASGEEGSISPGAVDFADFVRFEEIYNHLNGGDGAFAKLVAGVPEPSSIALVLLALGSLVGWRRRPSRRLTALVAMAVVALSASSASAVLTDDLLFSFENGSFPDAFQRWDSNTVADNTVVPNDADTDPDDIVALALGATGTTHGTQALSITQRIPTTPSLPINGATVSIFGSESGLPTQVAAMNTALDVGANHYKLTLDATLRDAEIPLTAYLSFYVGLSASSATNDNVLAFTRGDGEGAIPDETVHVEIPLSIDPVNTNDSVLSVPNQAALAGSYNITIGLDGDWTGNATVHLDNIHLVKLSDPPKLTLEVRRDNGVATLKNVIGANSGAGDVIFDYYNIQSVFPDQTADFNGDGTVNAADYTNWRNNLGLMDTATQEDGDANGDGDVTNADYALWKDSFGQVSGGAGTSLNPGGWNSLDEQNVDPNGILEINNWAEGVGSTSSLSEARLIGSSMWSQNESLSLGNIFTLGGAENLVFQYREPTRRNFLVTGEVVYVDGPGAGGASVVPEPGSIVLLLMAGLTSAAWRRRS
jgi:hypothetical protein